MPPPDRLDLVKQIAAETGDLIATDSRAFTDLVVRRLMAEDVHWGRKVRQRDNWESRNSDAIAYVMDGDPSRKHLVDIVVNSHVPGEPPPDGTPAPAWQVYEGPNAGNGYWMQEPGVVVNPPVDPPPASDDELKQRIAKLEATVETLSAKLALLGVDTARRLGEVDALAQNALVVGRNASADVEKLNTRAQVIENALAQPVRTGQSLYHSHSVTILPKK